VPSQVRRELDLKDGDTLVWIKTGERYIVSVAKENGLSIYDFCYIALAERLNIKMVTADRRLWDKPREHPLASFL
jgi:predicted nucleic acid-binding protein